MIPSEQRGLLFERALRIRSSPARVLSAFFEPADLGAWWQVARSVTVPRPLAPYAIQWLPTDARDEVLGRLGGTLHGTVMDFRPGESFFVADLYYQPPDGAPIGPMAIEVSVRPLDEGRSTELLVRQSADDEGLRWQRYFQLMNEGWDRVLEALREHLEWSGLRSERSAIEERR